MRVAKHRLIDPKCAAQLLLRLCELSYLLEKQRKLIQRVTNLPDG